MKKTVESFPKTQTPKLKAIVLFLLISILTPRWELFAQSQMLWQSFGSGSANSTGAGSSIMTEIGEPFVGEASGNGVVVMSGFGALTSAITSVRSSKDKMPAAFTLNQNYPNPFNPSTVISFGIPEASHVSLQIFDIVGREVSTLVDEDLAPGNYRSRFIADHISSGVYFYRIIAAKRSDKSHLFVDTKKFVLLK